MKKLSFFKKIKLYFFYRKIILANKEELSTNYGLRVDNITRLYTVINLPKELYEEPYNVRKADIDNISRKYITEYSLQLSKYLDSLGLIELYRTYRISREEKYSYLFVVGFSLIDVDDFAKKIIFRYIPISIIILIASILFFLF